MKRVILAILGTGLLLFAQLLMAQVGSSASERSYRRARLVLAAGVNALGGQAAIESAANFSIKMRGKSYQIFASRTPEPPFEGWPFERTGIIDSKNRRLWLEEKLQSSTFDYVWWPRTIVTGDHGYFINLHSKTVAPLANTSFSEYRSWIQLIPHNILAEALQRAATLRWVGESKVAGRQCDVITYATSSGQQISLYFDYKSHLLTKYDFLYARNSVGDTSREFIFTGYHDIEGIKVPGRRVGYNAGHLSSEAEYIEVKFNPPVADSLFALPAGITILEVNEPEPIVTKLSDDVYALQNLPGGYNVFFVAFNDYILVAEAPESDVRSGLSEQAITMIKDAVPGKPIKYLILTHHHGDHASGARAYIAEGTTIVTTPGNRPFIQSLAAARFEISPDALARNPHSLSIETIANKNRTFADNRHEVEVHDIGPIDHAREMVVVYLPRERILFQSDLFNPIIPGEPVSLDSVYHGIAASDSASLLKFIEVKNWKVERIVGSHGRIATFEELKRSVRP